MFRIDDTGELINAPVLRHRRRLLREDRSLVGCGNRAGIDGLVLWRQQGRGVIAFAAGFVDDVQRLAKATDALRAEMVATDRYQRAMAKEAARRE